MQLKTKIIIGLSALAVLGAGFWLLKPERPSVEIGQVTASQPFISSNSVNSGLIQRFTFDGLDFVTGATTDSSGNGNLVLNTGIKTEEGVSGQAIYCDGKSYATRANASLNNFSVGTSSFSISYWVKTKTLGAATAYIWGKINSAPYYYVGVSTAGKSDIFLRGSTMSVDTVSLKTISDNKWHHIAYIVNRTSTSYVYIDGALDKTFDITTKSDETLDNTNILRLCASGAGTPTNYFTGSVDEFRFYNHPITTAEISKLYNQGKNSLDVATTLSSGLAIYHSFDGGYVTGTVSIDSGAYPANLLRAGSTGKITQKGIIGQAYLIPDNTSFLRTTAGANFTCSTGTNNNFSFSGWINTSGGASVKHIISLRNGTNSDNCFALTVSNSTGKLNLNLPNASAGVAEVESTGSVAANKWQHVGVTYNGATNVATYYINGVKDSSYSPSTTVVNAMVERVADRISIGSRAIDGAANFYNGYVDDFRIYKRTLTSSEMSKLYQMGNDKIAESWTKTLTDGLVGHWTFDGDKTSSTTFTDVSGNNRNGTRTNGVSTGNGAVGQAAKFDGVNDSVSISSFSMSTSTFTVLAWIKTTIGHTAGRILSRRVGGGSTQLDWFIGAGGKLAFYDGSSTFTSVGKAINDGKWHQIGIKATNGSYQYFVDGGIDGNSFNPSPSSTAYSLNIGYYTSAPLSGLVDDLRIYNYSLAQSEIYKLYKTGK